MQTAYFSLIHSLWSMAPLSGDPYQKYNSDKVDGAAQSFKVR